MKRLDDVLWGRCSPYLATALALVYLLVTGFRGLGESSLQWLLSSRELADQFAADPSVVTDWSHDTVTLLEIFGGFFYLATPTGYAEWVLYAVAVLVGAATTGMVFAIGRRLAGPLGGWMSFVYLVTIAPWLGTFTRLDPTFALLPVVLGLMLVWYAPDWPWWRRAALGAPLAAVATLLWPGTIAVVGLMLIVALLVPLHARAADEPGVTDAPTLPVDRLIIPVGALVLLLLVPLFWPAPVEQLGEFVIAALERPPAEFVFRGQALPPDRPPMYTGAAWIFEQLPLAIVAALITGIGWTFAGLRANNRRLAVGCATIAVGLLAFPVIFRDPRPFGVAFGPLFVAVAIPVAALVTCRFFSFALGRAAPSKKVRQVAIFTFVLAALSILFEVPRAVESPESYRSPMSARLTGWSASGDMPMRERMLPLRLVEESGADRNTRLYRGDWPDTLEIYERMGLLDDVATTSNPARADVAIRPVPAIAVDRFSAQPVEHTPALEDSTTTVYPEIHRPLFLIDRVETAD